MANHLAIATVTEALRQRILSVVEPVLPGVQVSAKRPEANSAQTDAQVLLFLYRATPNPALRNADLPTRAASGELRQRPCAALDLHYLLCFGGDDDQLIPQRMMGLVVGALHATPMLSPAEIRLAMQGEAWLSSSNLADEIERVKFSPAALSLDDLSKLWSVFFQTPYLLSLAYEASVVLLEADLTPHEPLRVQRRGVDSLPLREPQIEALRPVGDAEGPLQSGAQVEIVGRRLRGQRTLLRFDDNIPQPVTPERDTRLVVPAALLETLPAGVHTAQIVHEVLLGSPPREHQAVESNVVPFVLRPRIAPQPPQPGDAELAVRCSPAVQPGQKVQLLLNELGVERPRSHRLSPLDADAQAPRDTLRFAIDSVAPGAYLVRVQIDGAESPLALEADPDNPQTQRPMPQVTVA